MRAEQRWFPVAIIFVLIVSSMACNLPTPDSEPSEETGLPSATEAVQAVETEPEQIDGPAVDEPLAHTVPTWLPDGTIALIRSGSWESAYLKAVTAGGVVADLGIELFYGASVSSGGRWTASIDGPELGANIQVINLESGEAFNIPITPDYAVYGTAFDLSEQRLAFMELGSSGSTYLWNIIVVNLADRSTSRFETSYEITARPDMLPGRPIGWNAAGDMLILDTFLPDSEGAWAGLWGITMPPGAASAPLDTLPAELMIPRGSYLSSPEISRDGTRMLYLNRDYSYTPAGYVAEAYDLAVNQLWEMDLATGAAIQHVDAVDGSALLDSASWSMNGERILFGQGTFSGGTAFTAAGWKIFDSGTIREVGPAALPAGGYLQQTAWCRPDSALTTAWLSGGGTIELQVLNLASGTSMIVDAQQSIDILGCVP